MKNQSGGFVLLLAACFAMIGAAYGEKPKAQPEKDPFYPHFTNCQFFQRDSPGGKLTLFLSQWEDGRWMLNIEPGCIVAEVKHRKIGEDTYRFTFAGWGMVHRAKKALAINTSSFDVVYEKLEKPSMHKLVRISEAATPDEEEADGTDSE